MSRAALTEPLMIGINYNTTGEIAEDFYRSVFRAGFASEEIELLQLGRMLVEETSTGVRGEAVQETCGDVRTEV